MYQMTEALIANKIKDIYPRLMNYAVYLTRDKTLAHDLVQDTVKKVLENKSTWNDISNFTAWSVTIMRNRFLDIKKKKKELQFMPKGDDDEIDHDPGLPDERIDVETNFLFQECLKKIGEDRSELIIMNLIQGMTTSAISKILKISQNTILTWLTKAKFDLKDCIQEG